MNERDSGIFEEHRGVRHDDDPSGDEILPESAAKPKKSPRVSPHAWVGPDLRGSFSDERPRVLKLVARWSLRQKLTISWNFPLGTCPKQVRRCFFVPSQI